MNRNTEIFDEDLNPVLEIASKEDLDPLVEYLKKKMSEFLTSSDVFKKYEPDHTRYADLIAKEIRDFGGNSFVNIFRGKGPSYREIVCDVAKVMKAPYNKSQDIEAIEESILTTILSKALEKMSEEEKKDLCNELGVSNKAFVKGGTALTAQMLFRAGGFASYTTMLIVANAVARKVIGRGLLFTTNSALSKGASILCGPIGLAVMGIWTAIDIAGPSYRVTIPAVIHIAMLRKKYSAAYCPNPDCDAELASENFKFCPKCGQEIGGRSVVAQVL